MVLEILKYSATSLHVLEYFVMDTVFTTNEPHVGWALVWPKDEKQQFKSGTNSNLFKKPH